MIDERRNVSSRNSSGSSSVEGPAAAEALIQSNSNHGSSGDNKTIKKQQMSTLTKSSRIITVVCLCLCNIANYMDRFTYAPIQKALHDEFGISRSSAGFVQTSFIITYMITSPIAGYYGDRVSRKFLLVCAVVFWTAFSFSTSFAESYLAFLFFRAAIGVGEGVYSTIAPTILSDAFEKFQRTIVLTFYQLGVPLGSGLGYMISFGVYRLTGEWEWCFRVVPIATVICCLLLLFCLVEPRRGESEGATVNRKETTFAEDLAYISSMRSFWFVTFGFVTNSFTLGAISFWGPAFFQASENYLKLKADDTASLESTNSAFVFGALTVVAGIGGVATGVIAAKFLRKYTDKADFLISAAGCFLAVPLIASTLFLADKNLYAAYVLLFFGMIALLSNFVLLTDIVLYLVLPSCRALGAGIHMFIGHVFGDAISPWICGALTDRLYENSILKLNETISVTNSSYYELQRSAAEVDSYRYSLLVTTVSSFMSFVMFSLGACWVSRDRAERERRLELTRHDGYSMPRKERLSTIHEETSMMLHHHSSCCSENAKRLSCPCHPPSSTPTPLRSSLSVPESTTC